MFKKFKDKLAEEVKSSPQRIQQFAQAAQAAVTSASSSISDITNNDLFSIGDNDNMNKNKASTYSQQNTFQEVPLVQAGINQQNNESDLQFKHEDNQIQRRLSNSSFASDISFRLPSYESPSMYHLQSDMEVSASEAEEKGFSGSTVNLDRVTKEQLYVAYRHTRERCTKYKTQYADLARHYKILERENAKARNVLVETQDKALRRMSELREQCSLEQGAKAHLEKALRLEIEEKNIKIETLNTKLSLLQGSTEENIEVTENKLQSTNNKNDNDVPLISLATDDLNNERKLTEEVGIAESTVLNNKIEKLEQLLNKYKESLKSSKEKNAQLTTELQIITSDLESKLKENEQLQAATLSLTEARQKIHELNENIEELQNKNNSIEFLKNKEISIIEISLKNAQEEIVKLHEKIEILSKREEDYAISLAENKLSIHKELESKEAEIKSLKDTLANRDNEIQSLNIIINDYKGNISQLEEDCSKLRNDINDLNIEKTKVGELKTELDAVVQKLQSLEQTYSKTNEDYKCLQLQMKQETAEKLAMIDRNVYLENRNTQLLEENTKKSTQISSFENEIQTLKTEVKLSNKQEVQEEKKQIEEINEWKLKCSNLESEIQEERVELVKLQSEIEKLLLNHESIQTLNEQLNVTVNNLKSEITYLKDKLVQGEYTKQYCEELKMNVTTLRNLLNEALKESRSFKQFMDESHIIINENMNLLNKTALSEIARREKVSEDLRLINMSLKIDAQKISDQYKILNNDYKQMRQENDKLKSKLENFESINSIQLQKIQDLQNQNEDNTKVLNNYVTMEKNMLTITEKLKALEKENEELLISLQTHENEKEMSNSEFENKYDDLLKNYNILTTEHNKLSTLKDDYQKKTNTILDLEKRIDELIQENTSLKTISETISKNVTDIESELMEVRKSHSQIEIEKDHLNSVISELEENIKKEKHAKDTQTDSFNEQEQIINDSKVEIEQLKKEIEILKDINDKISEENKNNNLEMIKMKDIVIIHDKQVIEYEALIDENKRLQSDIEGLQSYMAKVSKENSQLNDKLREIIATNDSVPEKNEMYIHDIESLQSEIQLGKNRIDDLVRENSLLAEENLELKDQIKSQSYSKTVTDTNSVNNEDIIHKYNNLTETKNRLEKKVNDLELINQSVTGNMNHVQTNNEKLRLSNEKLERRLDEALVSLRHLHSLQENTELEYLRNILYEYLTGSGTHSLTLAKVLSAVVKFDDKQTEMVLEKEKERQGLLHQLGIF